MNIWGLERPIKPFEKLYRILKTKEISNLDILDRKNKWLKRISWTIDKVKQDNYVSTLKDLKLQHIDRTISEQETNLTSTHWANPADKIVESEHSDSSFSEIKSNKNVSSQTSFVVYHHH